MHSSSLQVELIAQFIQPSRRTQPWQSDMHRGPQASPNIRRTKGQVTEPFVLLELQLLLDDVHALHQPRKHLLHIVAALNGNDCQVILLVYPDNKRLQLIYEYAAAARPVPVSAGTLQVLVSSVSEKVVLVDEGALVLFGELRQIVVVAVELAFGELFEGLANFVLHFFAAVCGQLRCHRKP